MRIAQIAPLHEAVRPVLCSGVERVVSFLAEELVAMGHGGVFCLSPAATP